MSQDTMVKLQCTACKNVTHFTTRNKKLKIRLELAKFCPFCQHHTDHKETK